jgi:hypothetical protein
MAAYVKFQDFVEQLGKGIHDLNADTLMLYLTNNTPDVALDAVKADLAGITEQFGYAAADAINTYTEASGTGTLYCTDKVWTASGGSFGPFRYVVMYNDTPGSPVDPLIAYWDYGSSITVLTGETFTVDFNPAGVLTIA